jgi:O-antigen/teichoic acid export membrane protein
MVYDVFMTSLPADGNTEKQNTKKESRNIKGGILLSYLTFFVSIAISIYLPRFLLDRLSDAQYGLNSYAVSLSAWVMLLAFGTNDSYIRFVTEAAQKDPVNGPKRINGFYFVLFGVIGALEVLAGLIVALLFQFNAIPVDQYSPDEKSMIGFIVALWSLSHGIALFAGLFPLYCNYKSKLILQQSLALASKIIIGGGTFLAVYLGGNIVWTAIMALIGQIFVDGVSVFFCFRNLKMEIQFPNRSEFWALFKRVFAFSLFVFMVSAVDLINGNIGKTVLGNHVKGDVVTIFALGYELYSYEGVMSSAINDNVFPKVTRIAVEGKMEELNSLFLKISKMQTLVLCLIVGGYFACGQDFIIAWAGESRSEAFYIGAIFLTLWLLPLSETAGVTIQRALNKHQFLAITNLVLAVLGIGVTILCVIYFPDNYKIYGATMGTVFSVVLGMWIISNVYYKKSLHLPVGHFFLSFVEIALISAISWAACYCLFRYALHVESFNPWLRTLFKGLVFCGCYFPLAYLLFHKAINERLSDAFKKE